MRTAVCCREVVAPPISSGSAELAALHLRRHRHHLVERGRDQTGEPDGVAALLDGRAENRVAVHHHAEIDDLVAVAGEHDADDVLADVVHVALDGREHDLAGVRAAHLLGLHERLEVGDRALHHARALDDLRQEHAAVAEALADDLHAVHQRPLDDRERAAHLEARLLGVGLGEVDDAVHDGVREPLADGRIAPAEIDLALGRAAGDAVGELDEALRGVAAAGEDHVLDVLEQLRGDVLVDRELARVDDPHVEAGVDRVVQEGGVHRLAHDLVAAEREREVRDAAARERAGTALLDQPLRLDEALGEEIVLLHPRRDGEDVGVEDDVLGPEADLLGEQVVGAAADRDLALDRLGLAALVEGHDDDGRPEAGDLARFGEEVLLALLERDRVHDPLALEAAQPGLDHRPARAVDHDRDARDLGLGGDQVEEARHRGLGVEHPLVHVDVEHVRAAAHLLERDVDRAGVVVGLDQAPEARRPGHVGALADHHEARLLLDRERLETGEARQRGPLRDRPRCESRGRRDDRRDVLGRRPAAAADAVDEAALGELAQQRGGLGRRLLVVAERVRQPGVRIAPHGHRGHACELREPGAHLGSAERAVDRDGQRLRVLDRGPERLHRLPRERAPAAIDDGQRDHDRHVRRDVLGGHDRRLRVERVEDGLDQEEVDAALGEAAHLLGVAAAHLVEARRPVRRVVDARRHRQRHVERPDRAGREARALRGRGLVAGLPCQPRPLGVEFPHHLAEAVVGLADRRRGERVGRRDVGARGQEGAVDLGDDVRPRQVEHVGIAGHVARAGGEALAAIVGRRQPARLDHRAPGTVEHDDPLRHQRL